MTRVIGLTGGIASGKSTVARMFEKLGAVVIDADAIVREVQGPDSPVLAEIAAAFGPVALDARGKLDRAALGALVFRDAAQRRRLNEIVHPAVIAEIRRRVAAAREAKAKLVVLDVPLLMEVSAGEAASRAGFDAVVVVWVPEAVQLERQRARDGCDPEEALRRVRAQLPIDEKRARADHVIDNSGTLDDTERQVRALYATLVDSARTGTEIPARRA